MRITTDMKTMLYSNGMSSEEYAKLDAFYSYGHKNLNLEYVLYGYPTSFNLMLLQCANTLGGKTQRLAFTLPYGKTRKKVIPKGTLQSIQLLSSLTKAYPTLYQEAVAYMSKIHSIPDAEWRPNGNGIFNTTLYSALFNDLLLSNCVCLVEQFEGNKVKRFLATRSKELVLACSDDAKVNTKLKSINLTVNLATLKTGGLPVIKLTKFKPMLNGGNSLSVSCGQKATVLQMGMSTVITPLFLLQNYMSTMTSDFFNKAALHIMYLSDEGRQCEFDTTYDLKILKQYYSKYDSDVINSGVPWDISTCMWKFLRLDAPNIDEAVVEIPVTSILSITKGVRTSDNIYKGVNLEKTKLLFWNYVHVLYGINADVLNKIWNLCLQAQGGTLEATKLPISVVTSKIDAWVTSLELQDKELCYKTLHQIMYYNNQFFKDYMIKVCMK